MHVPDRATRIARAFGELLRPHRLAAHLTQEELAEQAQLSRRAIQELERGTRSRPRRKTVHLLAEALGLDTPARASLEAAARLARTPGTNGLSVAQARGESPVLLTNFVGREREVAQVSRLLDVARLVTLTGAGGIGKTRLALQVASSVAHRFAQGVLTVELAALTADETVMQRVGRARREQSVGLNMAGGMLAYLGDYATARARYAESMECCQELGDKTGMADALSRQGFAALAERDVVEAQGLCESALRLAREEGNGGAIAWALLNLALVRLTQQDGAAARELCIESICLGDDTDEAQARLALGMELMASVATEAGDSLRALHLFGAAAAVSTTRGTRFNLFDRMLRGRWLCEAERAIGEPAAAEANSSGRAFGPAHGKALALENRPYLEALTEWPGITPHRLS